MAQLQCRKYESESLGRVTDALRHRWRLRSPRADGTPGDREATGGGEADSGSSSSPTGAARLQGSAARAEGRARLSKAPAARYAGTGGAPLPCQVPGQAPTRG